MEKVFQIKSFFDGLADRLFVYSNRKKCTLIIPAFNEEKTIQKTIKAALGAIYADEVIVVDDGSSDKTFEIASKTSAKVIKHEKNKGKGMAIKTGIKNAKYDIICFIDADLPEWTSSKINMIIKPVATGEADFVKTSFNRSSGRVTLLTAKPLLKMFFPNINFEQPLSGQFCTTKEFLSKIKIENRYGIDIGLVIDASSNGLKTKEVYIGEITNKSKKLQDLQPMAEEVAKTIAKKAEILSEKYPLIILCLEKSFKDKENSLRLFNETMNALKTKGHEIILISTNPKKELLEFIDEKAIDVLFTEKNTKEIKTEEPLELLCKSYKIKPKKVLFVAEPALCMNSFKQAGLKISTPNSCKKIKQKADKQILSWPELLLFAK
ncbi:MAG: glycosyltransferase [archaeon]